MRVTAGPPTAATPGTRRQNFLKAIGIEACAVLAPSQGRGQGDKTGDESLLGGGMWKACGYLCLQQAPGAVGWGGRSTDGAGGSGAPQSAEAGQAAHWCIIINTLSGRSRLQIAPRLPWVQNQIGRPCPSPAHSCRHRFPVPPAPVVLGEAW